MKISKVLGAVTAFGSNLYWASVIKAEENIDKFIPKDPLGRDGGDSVLDLAKDVINIAIFLAALVCVVVLIASGYAYITASGDEQKIEKATKTLTFAIVGLVICFIAVILVQFVLTRVLEVPGA
jgi:type III secretory pathway component EscU